MSNKLRRQKDLIGRRTSEYIEATTTSYTKYLEGSPTYITYYRLDDIATKQDSSLENVHSLTGANTPNKYQKIVDVVVYGVDAMDIQNEINEKGLESMVTGDFIMLPDSIKPYPGDFFTFDYDGLRDHLFRVEDVQFDRASPKKFYRISYDLYPENVDDVFENISGDFVFNYDAMGGELAGVVSKASHKLGEKAKDVVDDLIEKFTSLFYNEDLDIFAFEGPNMFNTTDKNQLHIWSPYLQKFLHDNKVLEHFNREILTEFYIIDINQRSNPEFFNDKGYIDSIFRKVETQNPVLTFENSFMGVLRNFDINQTRNLPFFHSGEPYRVGRVYDGNESYLESFHILNQNYWQPFWELDSKYKFSSTNELSERSDDFKNGDVIYWLSEDSPIIPKDVFLVGDNYFSISFNSLMRDLAGTKAYLVNEPLFSIIRSYLKDQLTLTEELLTLLNSFYYELTFKNYILVPLVIFVLKQLITDTFKI